MRILLFALVIVIAILTGACSSTNDANQTVPADETDLIAANHTISIDDLAGVMADTEIAYTVVNVHIPYQGEIDGTDYNIAFNDIDALSAALPDKDAPIILYCRSGNMSEQTTRNLVELGYTQIYDVPGGMNAWQSSGRTLVNNQ